jgi:hypothetical protein
MSEHDDCSGYCLLLFSLLFLLAACCSVLSPACTTRHERQGLAVDNIVTNTASMLQTKQRRTTATTVMVWNMPDVSQPFVRHNKVVVVCMKKGTSSNSSKTNF